MLVFHMIFTLCHLITMTLLFSVTSFMLYSHRHTLFESYCWLFDFFIVISTRHGCLQCGAHVTIGLYALHMPPLLTLSLRRCFSYLEFAIIILCHTRSIAFLKHVKLREMSFLVVYRPIYFSSKSMMLKIVRWRFVWE